MHTIYSVMSINYIILYRANKSGIYGTGSSSGHSSYTYYRKEKALKIYTEDDKPEKERED